MTTASPHRALRVRPWPVDPTTAHLVPYATRRLNEQWAARTLTPELKRWLERGAASGVDPKA